MTENALKEVRLPTFEGQRGTFRSFYMTMTDTLNLKQVHPSQWARVARVHIRGNAREWLLMYDPDMLWDYPTMMAALHREYQLEDPTSALIQFRNIYQRERESAAAYLERLERGYHEAHPNAHVYDPARGQSLICQALLGLRPEIRDRLSAEVSSGTFERFKEVVKKEEAYLAAFHFGQAKSCLLYTSPSPRDA